MPDCFTDQLFASSRAADDLQAFLAALRGKHGLRAFVAFYAEAAQTIFRLFGDSEEAVLLALKRMNAPETAVAAAQWIPAVAESLLYCQKDLKLWAKRGESLEAILSRHQHLWVEYLDNKDLPGCGTVRTLLEALHTLLAVADDCDRLTDAEATRAKFAHYLLTGDSKDALPVIEPEEQPAAKKKSRVSSEARRQCQHLVTALPPSMLVTMCNAFAIALDLYRGLLSDPDPDKILRMAGKAGPAGMLFPDTIRCEYRIHDLLIAVREHCEDNPLPTMTTDDIPPECKTPEGWVKPIVQAIEGMSPALRENMTDSLKLFYFTAGVIQSLSKKKAKKIFEEAVSPNLRPMIPFALKALALLFEAFYFHTAEP